MSIAEKFEIIADEVYDAGKKAEYDAFWDNYFEKKYWGSIYGFAMFAGPGWKKEICKPNRNRNIQPKYAAYMFAYNQCIEDLDQWCEENNITIDFSESTMAAYTFYGCGNVLKKLGILDFSSVTSFAQTFYGATGLHTIGKLILNSDGSQNFYSTFQNNVALENLAIEGTIGQNGFDVRWSPKLSKESITSIINALSTTTSGLAVTFSQFAVEEAFTSDEWTALIATKPNWTISLAIV